MVPIHASPPSLAHVAPPNQENLINNRLPEDLFHCIFSFINLGELEGKSLVSSQWQKLVVEFMRPNHRQFYRCILKNLPSKEYANTRQAIEELRGTNRPNPKVLIDLLSECYKKDLEKIEKELPLALLPKGCENVIEVAKNHFYGHLAFNRNLILHDLPTKPTTFNEDTVRKINDLYGLNISLGDAFMCVVMESRKNAPKHWSTTDNYKNYSNRVSIRQNTAGHYLRQQGNPLFPCSVFHNKKMGDIIECRTMQGTTYRLILGHLPSDRARQPFTQAAFNQRMQNVAVQGESVINAEDFTMILPPHE
jgi:hypothetical protein